MADFSLEENETLIHTSSVQVKDISGSLVRDRTFLIHELPATLQLTNYRLVLSPERAAQGGIISWWWDEILEIFLHKQRGFYVMQPECAAVKLRSGDTIFFENNDVFFAYEKDAVRLLEVIWFTAACALVRHSISMQMPRPRLPRVVNWSLQSDTLSAVFGVLNTVYDVASSAGHYLNHMVDMSEAESHVYLPKIALGDGLCRLYQWLVGESWHVEEGQPIAKVMRLDIESVEIINATSAGVIHKIARPLEEIRTGQIIASIDTISAPAKEVDHFSVYLKLAPPSSSVAIARVIFEVRSSAHGGFENLKIVAEAVNSFRLPIRIAKDVDFQVANLLVVKLQRLGCTVSAEEQSSCRQYDTTLPANATSASSKSGHLIEKNIEIGPPLASRKDLYRNTSSSAPPSFKPSFASIPKTIVTSGDTLSDLFRCLANERHVQSFLSDLSLTYADQTSGDGAIAIRDEALHVSPFDESLYCQIVLENHRYSLADLYDKEQEEGERRASKGLKWGSLYGLFTLNPLIPFFASNQARLNAPKHKKLEELIPDPKLLFLQDHYSLISMTQAGTPPARLRRLILHPVTSGDQVYLRILPAIVTGDSVIPCQIFSFGGSYFMRPICAGIPHQQPNYNARQIHRQYYHLRADGSFADTGTRINVKGDDIDTHRYKLYRFACDTRELEYYYIDYVTEPGHVF